MMTPKISAPISTAGRSAASASALRRRFETATDADFYRDRQSAAQARSLAGRALLRALLHQQLGAWWSRAPVDHQASGAPFLPDYPECAVNVSHSGEQVAAAACPGIPLGIDIEWVDPGFAMAPVARRFGRELLLALDQAWGLAPEAYTWRVAPESFDQSLELPAIAGSAPELLAAAWRLLGQLQLWLRARRWVARWRRAWRQPCQGAGQPPIPR